MCIRDSSTSAASLIELQTVYSVEDVYDLLEVKTIDAHNRKISFDREKAKARIR